MMRLLLIALSSLSVATAFAPSTVMPSAASCLHSKKDAVDEVVNQQAFAAGSFVEFSEKKRIHVGKIESVEHKSSGGARYHVLGSEGKKFNIPTNKSATPWPAPTPPVKPTNSTTNSAPPKELPSNPSNLHSISHPTSSKWHGRKRPWKTMRAPITV
mmetsp:Transcript_27252/g.43046  ORF Transcript_27252/g.43046 Transcript_27252/m.43046 type:complete len:157 (-) Transcript_27252:385-855(-)